MKKASMGVRFGAFLLDNIFLNIINMFLYTISPYSIIFISPVVAFLYFGICEGSSMSASPGKKICGLVVVDQYGNRLSSAQGFTRSICRLLSAAVCGIGFLIALFDEDGKAMHDKLANTWVVSEAASRNPMVHHSPLYNNPSVICISGPFAGRSFNVTQQGTTFGRDRNLCEIAFADNTNGISRIHCKLQFNPQTQMFVLYDMGSTNGTFLENGTRILQDQPIALRPGEGFYLAANTNFFRVSL